MAENYIAWLLARGFDPSDLESRAFNGNTPLLQAALEGNDMMVERLLEAGVDLYAVNNDFNGVIFNACYADCAAIIARLFAAGADIDDINENGETPLMYAVSASRLNSVKALLSLGADKSMQNMDGYCAIDFAVNRDVLNQLRYA
jgi:ankyrin repeat protein